MQASVARALGVQGGFVLVAFSITLSGCLGTSAHIAYFPQSLKHINTSLLTYYYFFTLGINVPEGGLKKFSGLGMSNSMRSQAGILSCRRTALKR